MAQVHQSIIPVNNQRLPDALLIKHGPAPLLSRFVLEGDRYFRNHGVNLRLRYDFDELLYINKQEVARGTWYRLLDIFNPEYSDLTAENAYWISGEDENGEIVLTQAGRVYHWPESTLADEARLMFYGGRDVGQSCRVTSEAAEKISGYVFNGGGLWLRRDFRGKGFPSVIGRLGRSYATARWPLDWATCFVTPGLVEKGVAGTYGYQRMSPSLFFPGSPIGDVEAVVLYAEPQEIYDDLSGFLAGGFAGGPAAGSGAAADARRLGETVSRISPVSVLQGSTSLS
jgi:hypothetical protein